MSDETLQERNKQTLTNISQLQDQEQQLYYSLNDVSLTPEKRQLIVNKINEISQMRINLYTTLKNNYNIYQKNTEESRDTLGQQISAIDILENELNESKRRLNLINTEKNNKLRLVEINTYYGKRYNAHSKLMQTIVFTCIPLIIFSTLYNKGLLPSALYSFLCLIVLVVGIYFIAEQLLDIANRDNMNYDEYNWYFNKSLAPSPDYTNGNNSSSNNPWETPTITCIGSACCDQGTTYNSDKNICVINETFENLNKYGRKHLKSTPINNNIVNSLSSLQKF
jgi:hypothetical protein